MGVGRLSVSSIAGAFAAITGLGLASSAMATPVLTVTTSSGSQNVTLVSIGGGAYAATPGSAGGFTWGAIGVNVSSSSYSQVALQINSVANTNPTTGLNSAISFSVSDSGLSATPNSFLSIQESGSATSSLATSAQTVDFSGSAVNSSTTVGTQDSGDLALNTSKSYLSSSSVSYSSLGSNLSGAYSTLTLNAETSLSIDPGMKVNGTDLAVNIDTATVTTPEPAALGLFAVGGLVLLAARRRRMA